MAVSNTLAYDDLATITATKVFIVQAYDHLCFPYQIPGINFLAENTTCYQQVS
jgi:hypothetical protein